MCPDISLVGKNIIIVDDQLTTGATAFEIRKKLEEQNVGNIVFVTLFYMILEVKDDKICPRCGQPLSIKINRRKNRVPGRARAGYHARCPGRRARYCIRGSA